MCDFEAWVGWRSGIIFSSSYFDVDSRKDQYCLINQTPLECITGYIIKDDVGDRDLKKLPQKRLNFIDGSIQIY